MSTYCTFQGRKSYCLLLRFGSLSQCVKVRIAVTRTCEDPLERGNVSSLFQTFQSKVREVHCLGQEPAAYHRRWGTTEQSCSVQEAETRTMSGDKVHCCMVAYPQRPTKCSASLPPKNAIILWWSRGMNTLVSFKSSGCSRVPKAIS